MGASLSCTVCTAVIECQLLIRKSILIEREREHLNLETDLDLNNLGFISEISIYQMRMRGEVGVWFLVEEYATWLFTLARHIFNKCTQV